MPHTDTTSLEHILSTFKPIGLEEMKAVRLMNRVDQKYITSVDCLPELLSAIAPNYYVQRIDGDAFASYRTLYFDTPELEMYTHHHNKKLTRQKVRVRCYRSSLTTFFEIKNKDNKKKTKKVRVPLSVELFDSPFSDPDVRNFLHDKTPYTEDSLVRHLENNFRRITLVDHGFNERVTIDNGITFHNHITGINYDISKLVILEVKHEVGAPPSPIERTLRDMRIHPNRISKYCIGTVLTNPAAKCNRFKPKIRLINKIINHNNTQIN